MRDDEREHRRILSMISELRREGFEVDTNAPIGPSSLTADIVARKGSQTIVVEVKTSVSLGREKTRVAKLADYVSALPGHRFDLVLTNPRRRRAPAATAV